MEVKLLSETRKEALAKWREYKDAVKKTRNPLYKDLQKVYNQVKSGRKVIDITEAIKSGGVHTEGESKLLPKLAIARADAKKISCSVLPNGTVSFRHPYPISGKYDFTFSNLLPTFQWSNGNQWQAKNGEAPLPIIPPKYLPEKLTDDYYILWEVDEWKMVPPTDPWLLRRITKNMFVVLEGWDLTDIEKSVMASRL